MRDSTIARFKEWKPVREDTIKNMKIVTDSLQKRNKKTNIAKLVEVIICVACSLFTTAAAIASKTATESLVYIILGLLGTALGLAGYGMRSGFLPGTATLQKDVDKEFEELENVRRSEKVATNRLLQGFQTDRAEIEGLMRHVGEESKDTDTDSLLDTMPSFLEEFEILKESADSLIDTFKEIVLDGSKQVDHNREDLLLNVIKIKKIGSDLINGIACPIAKQLEACAEAMEREINNIREAANKLQKLREKLREKLKELKEQKELKKLKELKELKELQIDVERIKERLVDKSRAFALDTDDNWSEKKKDIMNALLIKKAQQCAEYRQDLLRSKDRILVVDSQEYWARGRGRFGQGLNMRGKLMHDRNRARSPAQRSLRAQRNMSMMSSRNPPTHKEQRPTCYNCDERGHSAETCRLPSRFFCYTCGGQGHKSKFCSKKYDQWVRKAR